MRHETTTQNSPLLKNISWNMVLSGIVSLLLLMVFLQSLQLQQLKGYAEGFLQGQKVQAASAAAPTAAPARSSGSGLPTQVGGC